MLELDGKNLSDEGCLAIIEGLVETLQTRDGVSANKLEELHLTGNQLTTISLCALAPVIELARFELIDLDLSDNHISVKTDDEARNWETFLKAFCGCRVLRRLDLSRNHFDGPRAFEILNRVYSQQPPVDPTQLEEIRGYDNDQESGTESAGDLAELTNRARNLRIASATDDSSTINNSMSAATVLKRREGLRAVPYIILYETGMTDAGALSFSYVLQKHYYPQQLMCPLRPGPQATQLDEYRHRSHCWGLVYLPNDGLTDTGRRLLEKAEDCRSEFTGIEEDMAELSGSVGSFVVVGAKQASSAIRRNSNASLRRRSDVATEPGKKHAVALDVENYRKKIQRNILEDLGYESIDLWRCAVKMLTYAKFVMLGHEQADDSPLPVVDRTDPVVQRMEKHMYASRMTAASSVSGQPVLSITGVSREPNTLDVETWPALPTSGATEPRKITVPVIIKDENDCKIDQTILENMSGAAWKEVLVQAAGGEGILSDAQQNAIINYARDRRTPMVEKSAIGKPKPFKLWWILERMSCLAYDMKE
ncbi:hypothetical protein MPH_09713 [Macrophomina phaseolina MS6]|uniref:Leucine rich repeat protein n=1 Tax=Macrophomina phaseolina (strain MS6) TaxID=1126212 RepID=K2REV0_MACPH|nr:hypothetical protein MPH_09713 [Macrophomina phaseolina MS6]